MSDLIQFIKSLPTDERRHPLIADNDDWDRIVPAIIEWASMLGCYGSLDDALKILRVLTEGIYLLGYERGKRETAREA